MSFEAAYDFEINPEFPSSGRWTVPTYAFRRDWTGVTRVGEAGFHSTWGTPLIVRVTPHDSAGWVGFFEAGGSGGITMAAIATPGPAIACIVNDGAGYVVEVEHPERHRLLQVMPVRGSCPLPEFELLLLWDWCNAAAIGPAGVVWESGRLCLDDLEIVGSDEIGIRCRGAVMPAEIEDFHVDPATGRPVDRPLFSF